MRKKNVLHYFLSAPRSFTYVFGISIVFFILLLNYRFYKRYIFWM
jgi:hypothetical protein